MKCYCCIYEENSSIQVKFTQKCIQQLQKLSGSVCQKGRITYVPTVNTWELFILILMSDFKAFLRLINMPNWLIDPFSHLDIAGLTNSEEELIKIIINEELKVNYKMEEQEFWIQ